MPYSALNLRTVSRITLFDEAAIHKLDPDRRDVAMGNIVLIGHSQGGLLATMLVITSGSRLFDALSSKVGCADRNGQFDHRGEGLTVRSKLAMTGW